MPPDSVERKLRAMHVVSGDLWAGAEAQACTLLTNLARRDDVEPSAVVLNHGELEIRLRSAGIRTWVLDESEQGVARLAAGLRRAMRDFKPDIVHTHRQKENVLGAFVAASLGIPSLRTAHGAQEHAVGRGDVRRAIAHAIDAFAANHVQRAVVAVSDELAERIHASWPRAHVQVIDNVVDADALQARIAAQTTEGAPPLHREVWAVGAPGEPKQHIGLVGRLVPVKRVDLFLDVAEELSRRVPGKYCFDIVGEGPLMAELRNRSATMNHVDVRYHGFLSDPLPLIAQLDVLLITSDHEGLPTVALEALAVGVPVVSRPVGGLPALSLAGAGCVLTPEATLVAIADTVQKVLDEGYGSRPRLPERYRAANGAARYTALYRSLICA